MQKSLPDYEQHTLRMIFSSINSEKVSGVLQIILECYQESLSLTGNHTTTTPPDNITRILTSAITELQSLK
jgi:hypothetical protein